MESPTSYVWLVYMFVSGRPDAIEGFTKRAPCEAAVAELMAAAAHAHNRVQFKCERTKRLPEAIAHIAVLKD